MSVVVGIVRTSSDDHPLIELLSVITAPFMLIWRAIESL